LGGDWVEYLVLDLPGPRADGPFLIEDKIVVKIRLKRFGRKNLPFWRINAVDHRSPRDGKVIEELGFYDPVHKDKSKQVVVDMARVVHWVKAGAQPSHTVKQLLKRAVDSGAVVKAAGGVEVGNG
jgi:small subunit ribosomal protein S16